MKHFGALTTAVALALLSSAEALRAQGRITSTIAGTVTDAQGRALDGVAVAAASPSLMGAPRSATTTRTGSYRLTGLPSGTYELTASMKGYRAVRLAGIRVPYRASTIIDLRLTPGTEPADRRRDGTLPDTASAGIGTRIDETLLQSLPVSRFAPDLINLAPAVAANVAFGGTQASNLLLLEGVDVTDPETAAPWALFNYHWIQEIHIGAPGAGAREGDSTGAIASVALRSGGNRFAGLGEYWALPVGWTDSNLRGLSSRTQQRVRPRETTAEWEGSAQLGGPLQRDRVWFFTGFQYARRESQPAGFTRGSEMQRTRRAVTKLSWLPAVNALISGYYARDSLAIAQSGIGPTRPPETTIAHTSPQNIWNAHLAWTASGRTFVEVRNGGYVGHVALDPAGPGTRDGPVPRFDADSGVHADNAPFFARFERSRHATHVSLTHYVDGLAGRSHEIEAGVGLARSRLRNEVGHPGGRLFSDFAGAPFLVTFWDGDRVTATGRRVSAYVQDRWRVSDRLTLNPGIRVALNDGAVPNEDSAISTRAVGPRAGATLDVTGTGRTILRGHFGRYQDPLLTGTFTFRDTSGLHPQITALVLGPNSFREIERVLPPTGLQVAEDPSPAHVDEFLISLERQVTRDLSIDGSYIWRDFGGFLGFEERGAQYAQVQRRDPGPDNRPTTGDDGALVAVFSRIPTGAERLILANPDSATRRYDAIRLTATQRYAEGWQLLAGYTWSRTKGTVDNASGTNAAQGFGSEGLGPGGVFSSPNRQINQDGRATFDFTHQIDASGSYRVPLWGGFTVGAIYRHVSGAAWGRRATIRLLPQGSEVVRIEPRGARRAPALSTVDVRLEKLFPLRRGSLRPAVFVDVFNTTNRRGPDIGDRSFIVDASGSSFGEAGRWIMPRTFHVGVRVNY